MPVPSSYDLFVVIYSLAVAVIYCFIVFDCQHLTSFDPVQVDYSSLIDVRIVKHGNLLNTAKPVPGDQNVASGCRQLDKDMETHAATKGTK